MPPKVFKDYFDDPTLSDLTIRLSDRCVHVHRIILCRNSEYFRKLILTGFKVSDAIARVYKCLRYDIPELGLTKTWQESDQKGIQLHDDDPSAMILLLRYIYDLPYDDVIKDEATSMSFLAKVYVAADKYQIESLKIETHYQIRKHKLCKDMTDIDDFLNALETIATGTAPQGDGARKTMINICIKWIAHLRREASFLELCREHDDVGADIIAHDNLGPMTEGMWYCHGVPHAGAEPRCVLCTEWFSDSYIRSHRHLREWTCNSCEHTSPPLCTRCEDFSGAYADVEWRWNNDEDD